MKSFITMSPVTTSQEAMAAETPAEQWSLFFTDHMVELMVTYTNEKIETTLQVLK